MPWGKKNEVDMESKWLMITVFLLQLLPLYCALSNDQASGTKENNSFSNNLCASKDQMNFWKAFLDKLFGSICT